MKIIIIPDSFKGTLSSLTVCKIIEKALTTHKITSIPIADGGEGTLSAFSNLKSVAMFANSQLISVPVKDALGKSVNAPYLLSKETAVIEMAKVASYIPNASRKSDQGKSLVMHTSTYGVGMLIHDAIKKGAKKIIIGLGGSCTNDGGCGMAAALGTLFYNHKGDTFIPTGGTLSDISYIDNSETIALISGNSSISKSHIDIIGMCDVDNPLCGKSGAAYVFGPQKGASFKDVELLDSGLHHLVSLLNANSVAKLPGSGAAGGMGFGIRALLNGSLESGIDLLLDLINFDKLLLDTDYVITGEGRFDSQSMGGKAVSGICKRAKEKSVPVLLVAGSIKACEYDLKKLGIVKCFDTGNLDFGQPLTKIKEAAASNLERTAHEIANYM